MPFNVATPPHLHARQTMLATRAGKHILCEKPMALTTAEAGRMIEVSRGHGVALMICYYQRFNARHRRIRELLAEGAIGQVTAARINFSERLPPQPGVWHHNPAISGAGPSWIWGRTASTCCAICAARWSRSWPLADTLVDDSPVEDTATLLLRLSSGAQAVVNSHWSTANHDPERFNRLEICGTGGHIVAAPIQAKDSAGTLQLITAGWSSGFLRRGRGPRPHVALLDAFGKAVADGSPVPIAGEEGLAGLAVVEAALESARTGHRIPVADPSISQGQ